MLIKVKCFHQEKLVTEQLLQNNNKRVSRPKAFRKNTDTSRSAPSKAIIDRHQPIVNSVYFEVPCNKMNKTDNANCDTRLIDAHDNHTMEDSQEEEFLKM